MSHLALHLTRTKINRWLKVQLGVVVLAAVAALLMSGVFLAFCVFIGGILNFFPQWVFSKIWLNYYRAQEVHRLVKVFYISEVIKLVLIALLFIGVIKFFHVNLGACLGGFVLAQIALWVAPFIFSRHDL